ncbi:hypothetical protein C5167_036569 [Papaver somniferum]|uniref:Uncharacterized protein n=1 Tax=Papaver somniferum TaxID=3469 RepID=A0A4Y7I7X6_PAPSO|nr:hypothetical protein C5167_036569 [Papaver somniferum]
MSYFFIAFGKDLRWSNCFGTLWKKHPRMLKREGLSIDEFAVLILEARPLSQYVTGWLLQ